MDNEQITAYHEIGHVLMLASFGRLGEVEFCTIDTQGMKKKGAAGAVAGYWKDAFAGDITYWLGFRDSFSNICMLLGGYMAEKIYCGREEPIEAETGDIKAIDKILKRIDAPQDVKDAFSTMCVHYTRETIKRSKKYFEKLVPLLLEKKTLTKEDLSGVVGMVMV